MEIIGREIEIGVGVEKVRGTAQLTAEKWVKNVTANIIEKAEHVIDDNSHNVLEDSDNRRVVRKWIEGSIEGSVHADMIGYLLYNLYGSVTSSLLSGSVYSHSFNLLKSIQHPALTLFAKDGSVQQLSYATGMLSTLGITASVNDFVRMNATFMGKEASSNSDTPSYDTEYDFIGKDVYMLVADTEVGLETAIATKIKDVSINFDTGLISDHILGSYTPNDIYNAKMSIEGSFTKNFDATTFKDLYLADTAKYMQFVISGSADLGGGKNPAIVFTFNKVKITNWDRSGANDELATETVDFKAFYNETDGESSTVRIQNLTEEYSVPVSD